MMKSHDYKDLAMQLGVKNGRMGGQQFIAQCPLHHDNEPSFSLNIITGLWTCFAGCGAGNFPALVQKVNHCSRKEAADWIVQNSSNLTPIENPHTEIKQEPSLRWLAHFNSLDRKIMPQWWFDRGFTWETAGIWDIRYDVDEAQIVIPFYKLNPPIHFDTSEDQVLHGTITRNLLVVPKYKNSPNLPRNKYLFGKTFVTGGDVIYLTEGPLDCLALWQDGLASAAVLGAGLLEGISNDHVRQLMEFKEVCLAFDNDEAGHKTTAKVVDKLLSSGWLSSQITRMNFPDDVKDAGECIGKLNELAQHRQRIY